MRNRIIGGIAGLFGVGLLLFQFVVIADPTPAFATSPVRNYVIACAVVLAAVGLYFLIKGGSRSEPS